MRADCDVIERAIDIDASPETVFELLTDPAEYVRWKGRLADLDPRPGGLFHVSFKDSAVRGEYVEVVKHKRVVFTWGWEGPHAAIGPGRSTDETYLDPPGPVAPLHLVPRGLPPAELAIHTPR